MINTATIDQFQFLGGTPNENDKLIWKKAYATYLLVLNKTPEECITKPIPLIALRQILAQHDQRWQVVEPEMMVTTHTMVHRMNVFLKRFRARAWEVKVIMQGIRDQEEPSAEVEQTQNPERTDSDNSVEVPIKQEPCDLGLVNAPSVNENQEEEVNNEQSAEKPKEEANNQEPEQILTLQQEQVDVQVPKEEDQILKVRKRNEFELKETDMGIYGADMMAFLRARAAKKRAKTDLKEADAIYQKAKANLEELRDNFNAAFESSAEKEN